MVDLTLKLGLSMDNRNQPLRVDDTALALALKPTYSATPDFHRPLIHQKAEQFNITNNAQGQAKMMMMMMMMKSYLRGRSISTEGIDNVNGAIRGVGWPWADLGKDGVSIDSNNIGTNPYRHGFEGGLPHNYPNSCYRRNMSISTSSNVPPSSNTKQLLLGNNIMPSNAVGRTDSTVGSCSSSGRRIFKRRSSRTYINIDNRRCTNFNCNTDETPMWRKGPLGPKTLCNACGIKYRKEEEKRKAQRATSKENARAK